MSPVSVTLYYWITDALRSKQLLMLWFKIIKFTNVHCVGLFHL